MSRLKQRRANGGRLRGAAQVLRGRAGIYVEGIAATPPADGSRHRFLVVDDDPEFTRFLGFVLTVHVDACVVDEETDPVRALRRVIAGERFDAIVCDIAMPTMTGVELHEALSRFAPEQADRMIFVSGGLSVPAARYLRGLSNPLLSKPVGLDPLLGAMRDVHGL